MLEDLTSGLARNLEELLTDTNMTQQSYTRRLIRDVTKEECPWLHADMKVGDVVYSYLNYTYGCIGSDGEAFSMVFGEDPFFELPIDSVKAE